MIALKTTPKWPLLDTKSAIEKLDGSKRHENRVWWCVFAAWSFFSYLDAGFEPRRRCKDFWIAYGCLLPALQH